MSLIHITTALLRVSHTVTTLVIHNWRFRFKKINAYNKLIKHWLIYDDSLADRPKFLNSTAYNSVDSFLWWGPALIPAAEHTETDCAQTRFYYAAICNIDDFWALFCRGLYTYSTGQRAWYKYRYRYNLYRHKTLPPFSTTYTWINPAVELEYLTEWSMINNWTYLNFFFRTSNKLPKRSMNRLWINKKSRSIFRRLAVTPIWFKVIACNLLSAPTTRIVDLLTSICLSSASSRRDKTTRPTYIIFGAVLTAAAAILCTHLVHNFSIWAIIIVAASMPAVLLWQTFTFLYKTYRVSKYTAANQRFWKRSLNAFWAIELFLFIIVLYLWMNAPANLLQGVEHQTLVKAKGVTTTFLVESYYLPSTLLLLTHCFLLKNTNTTPKETAAFLFIINTLIWATLVVEFSQLQEVYYRSTDIHGTITGPTVQNGALRETLAHTTRVNEDLPVHQMKMLVTFLKFWHVLFIATFATFITIRLVEYRKISFDVIAAAYQNFAYLIVFNSMALIFLMKKTIFVYATRIPNAFVSQHPASLVKTNLDFYFDVATRLIETVSLQTTLVIFVIGLVMVAHLVKRSQNNITL